jgi:two-component system sensor histidine kinase TctE
VQRFYRGDNASGEGTGLGLAIVHEVALSHSGAFVITDAPGGGLRCEIHLPPASAPPAEAAGRAVRSATAVASPERG